MIYTRFSFWLSCAATAFPVILLPVPAWAMVIIILLVVLLALFRFRLATLAEAVGWTYAWYIMVTKNDPLIFWIGLASFVVWVISTLLIYTQFFLLRTVVGIGKDDGLRYTNKKRPGNRDGLNFSNKK